MCIHKVSIEHKTNFVTDPTITFPETHGSVDLFLNLMICFNLIIHTSIPIFENGTNSAAVLFRKINSGNCREVNLIGCEIATWVKSARVERHNKHIDSMFMTRIGRSWECLLRQSIFADLTHFAISHPIYNSYDKSHEVVCTCFGLKCPVVIWILTVQLTVNDAKI